MIAIVINSQIFAPNNYNLIYLYLLEIKVSHSLNVSHQRITSHGLIETHAHNTSQKHWWGRKQDLEISTLCGYGRNSHEGSDRARECKGRKCKCECHRRSETHDTNASQYQVETHIGDTSHRQNETHVRIASQEGVETHPPNTSH